jgi:organic radical activating enzyme
MNSSSVSEKLTAPISQLFSSLQGEGPRIGEKHLFVRFRDCNVHCVYCDEVGHASQDYDVSSLVGEIKALDGKQGPHRVVSLTGGEPLFYPQFLKALCPELVSAGFKIYLETSGILHKPLKELLPWVSFVAMDIKLPSVTKDKNYLAEHEQFFSLCFGEKTFIKIVVSRDIDLSELTQALEMIRRIHPQTLVVLQPMSPIQGEVRYETQDIEFVTQLQQFCFQYLENVRIIPRLHRLVGIL